MIYIIGMSVFLLIGSADVQPWASKKPAEAVEAEQAPLAGTHSLSIRF